MALPPEFFLSLGTPSNVGFTKFDASPMMQLGQQKIQREGLAQDQAQFDAMMDYRMGAAQQGEQWRREAEQRKRITQLESEFADAVQGRDFNRAKVVAEQLAPFGYEFAGGETQPGMALRAGEAPTVSREPADLPAPGIAADAPSWLTGDMRQRGLLDPTLGVGQVPQGQAAAPQMPATARATADALAVDAAAAGVMAQPEAAAPQAAGVPQIGAGFALRRPGGEVLHQWNAPQHAEQWADRVRTATEPLVTMGRNPQEKAIGRQAQEIGVRFMQQSPDVTVADAIKKAEQWYQKTLGFDVAGDIAAQKARAARLGASMGKQEDLNRFRAVQLMDKLVNRVETNLKVPDVRQAVRKSRQLQQLANSPNAIAQRAALGELVKSIFDSRPSNTEREAVESAQTVWSRIEKKYNEWSPNAENAGQLAEQFRKDMVSLGKMLEGIYERSLKEAGVKAAHDVENEGWIRDYYGSADPGQIAYDRITGGVIHGGPPRKKSEPSEPASKADQLLKKGGYK